MAGVMEFEDEDRRMQVKILGSLAGMVLAMWPAAGWAQASDGDAVRFKGHNGECERTRLRASGACDTCEGRWRAGGELARLFWERATEAGRSVFADQD